jgi:hypothetical protein
VPIAEPVAAPPPAGLTFNSAPDVLLTPRNSRKPPRRKRGAGRLVFLIGLTIVSLGAVGGGAWFLWNLLSSADEDERTAQRKQGNFQYKIPGGWKRDRDIEHRLGVNLGIRHKQRPSAMALFYRDYKTRSPSEAELLDTALEKLRGKKVPGRREAPYFRSVEYSSPFGSRKKEPTGQLGGQPAWVLEFRATEAGEDGAEVDGQVAMLTHRGYAYWFFTWGAGQRDLLVPDWESARQGFRILDGRQGWKEKPRPTLPFAGSGYELRYARDLWEKEANPTDHDPQAELVLRGFEPTFDEETGKANTERLAGKAATLQVLLLPRATDLKSAVGAAQEHLLKRQQETFPRTTMAPAKNARTDKPEQDGITEVGAFRGHLTKLHIKNEGIDEGRQRFGLRAVVKLDEGVLVVFGECDWERRDFWDHEFRQVLERIVRLRVRDSKPPKKEPKRPAKKKTKKSG